MPKVRKLPQRTCVGCGRVADKRDLVRVVRTPEGQVVIDPTGKKSGRGAYVCREGECVAKAVRGGRLSRALGTDIPEEVIETLRDQLQAARLPSQ
ncbi:MAG: YlxR family protein [Clostridia bacterium]|nr:YlxR family protein [Clostridia bacterium]